MDNVKLTLKAARVNAGLTQEEAGRHIGVSKLWLEILNGILRGLENRKRIFAGISNLEKQPFLTGLTPKLIQE